MVRLSAWVWSVAALALVGARPATASPIQLTGNVEKDFPATSKDVRVIPVNSTPNDVGPSPFIAQNGWVSGWAIKDIRTSYDAATDTLSVGLDTFKDTAGRQAIVGDADGNGDPGGASPQMQAAHGVDNPHLGGHKSVAVAFAPDGKFGSTSPGNPVVIAGVPADKSTAGHGIDGFTVAQYRNVNLGLGYNFGPTLAGNLGALAFDPSAQHPGFEFTIKNFSKIPGLDPTKGFWISAYAGSPDDVVVGESALDFTRVAAFAAEQAKQLPEPATLLGWSLVVGAAVIRWRHRSRPAGG
jgi:hypothetical protein